jgi:hypothetical protein
MDMEIVNGGSMHFELLIKNDFTAVKDVLICPDRLDDCHVDWLLVFALNEGLYADTYQLQVQ